MILPLVPPIHLTFKNLSQDRITYPFPWLVIRARAYILVVMTNYSDFQKGYMYIWKVFLNMASTNARFLAAHIKADGRRGPLMTNTGKFRVWTRLLPVIFVKCFSDNQGFGSTSIVLSLVNAQGLMITFKDWSFLPLKFIGPILHQLTITTPVTPLRASSVSSLSYMHAWSSKLYLKLPDMYRVGLIARSSLWCIPYVRIPVITYTIPHQLT